MCGGSGPKFRSGLNDRGRNSDRNLQANLVRIGEDLLVRSSSPNPSSRTFSISNSYRISGWFKGECNQECAHLTYQGILAADMKVVYPRQNDPSFGFRDSIQKLLKALP